MRNAVTRRMWPVAVAVLGLVMLGSAACAAELHSTRPFSALGAAPMGPHSAPSLLAFERSDAWLLAAGAAATVIALRTEDHDSVRNGLDGFISGPTDFGNAYGSAWVSWGMTLGMGAVGYVARNPTMTDAALNMGTSLALMTAVVTTIKVTTDRKRPDGGRYSFPSGHTAAAFSLAPVLQRHFGWRAAVPAYTAGVFTGFARIEDDKHHVSDVIAGATIGTLIGRVTSFPFRGNRVRAFVDGRGAGFELKF